MKLDEKQLSTENKFTGRMISVFYDIVELSDGRKSYREVVRHPGACAIIAQLPNGKIILEKQYRYAIAKSLIELPAGKIDKGEDHFICAKRELKEETGYIAKTWKYLGPLAMSAGFSDEIIHLYFATDLIVGEAELDEGEFLEVHQYTKDEVLQMIYKNEIIDSKTIAGILKALPYLKD